MSTREEDCSLCNNEMTICVTFGPWKLLVVSITNVVDRAGMVALVVDCTAGEEEVKAVPGNC